MQPQKPDKKKKKKRVGIQAHSSRTICGGLSYDNLEDKLS